MINRAAVAMAFATFNAAGCRPPDSHSTEEGLDFALRVWCSVLADLDRETLLALVVAYLRTPGSKWWPTPGELLALRVSGEDDAIEQWGRFLRIVSTHGIYGPPPSPIDAECPHEDVATCACWSFDGDSDVDAAIHAGLEAVGGWRRACGMHDKDAPSNRAAFRDAYRARLGRRQFELERAAVVAITAGPMPALTGRE